MNKKTAIILDGNSLLHRAWHALPPLMSRDGRVVNAAYGFSMVLEKMLALYKPDYMVVAWDLPGKTFRHEKYAEYKATREKKPQELYDQIPIVQEILSARGIKSLSAEGFEADDVIATIATEFSEKSDVAVNIVTGDMDALQLVSPKVTVVSLQKGISDVKAYDADAVKERFGVLPEQMVDYKALRGDPSDNIKGVPGVGEKTAVILINEFGSIEKLYSALRANENLGPKIAKLRDKLLSHEKDAIESKELVILVRDVPVKKDLEDLKIEDADTEKLRNIYYELGFKSLLAKMNNAGASEKPIVEKTNNAGAAALSAGAISGADKAAAALGAINKGKVAIFIVEEPATLFSQTKTIVQVSDGANNVAILCVDEDDWKTINDFLSECGAVIVHNAKDLFHKFESTFNPFDLMVASYLLNSSAHSHDLETIAREHQKTKITDASQLFRLGEKIESELNNVGMTNLFANIEMPLIPVLYKMENVGVKLDTNALKRLSVQISEKIDLITKEIHKLAGGEFNINSPQQVAEVLFEKLKIPVKGVKKTKTGVSTAAPELEKIHEAHPIVPLLEDYRELAKFKSTYVDALPDYVNSAGRIHTTFNQTVAATGRLSSSSPNLQNIPVRSELGRDIRKTFVAERGFKILAADYSQIELRLAAVLSGDQAFINAFNQGADIHRRTAAEVWEVEEIKVTKEQRHAAKAINFGIIYGMGFRALARATGLPNQEAQDFIDRYFEIHQALRAYLDSLKQKAHDIGYVENLFNRRRYFPEINSYMPQLVASAERMAMNMPVQGTAADIIKIAMINIDAWLSNSGLRDEIRMVLQIHDELVFEIADDKIKFAVPKIKELMENAVKLSVPLVVDLKVGDNLGEVEPI